MCYHDILAFTCLCLAEVLRTIFPLQINAERITRVNIREEDSLWFVPMQIPRLTHGFLSPNDDDTRMTMPHNRLIRIEFTRFVVDLLEYIQNRRAQVYSLIQHKHVCQP